MTSEEILKERKRIKQVVEEQVSYAIEKKRRKARKIKHHHLSFTEIERKIKKNILFWIDNPDYIRKKKEVI